MNAIWINRYCINKNTLIYVGPNLSYYSSLATFQLVLDVFNIHSFTKEMQHGFNYWPSPGSRSCDPFKTIVLDMTQGHMTSSLESRKMNESIFAFFGNDCNADNLLSFNKGMTINDLRASKSRKKKFRGPSPGKSISLWFIKACLKKPKKQCWNSSFNAFFQYLTNIFWLYLLQLNEEKH